MDRIARQPGLAKGQQLHALFARFADQPQRLLQRCVAIKKTGAAWATATRTAVPFDDMACSPRWDRMSLALQVDGAQGDVKRMSGPPWRTFAHQATD